MFDLGDEPRRETITLGLGAEHSSADGPAPGTLEILDALRQPPPEPLVKRLGLLAASLVLLPGTYGLSIPPAVEGAALIAVRHARDATQ